MKAGDKDAQKAMVLLSAAALAAIVVYSFVLTGSPAHNRLLLEDKARLDSLERIECSVRLYRHAKGALPESLAVLEEYAAGSGKGKNDEKPCGGWCEFAKKEDFKDPASGAYYEYIPRQNDTYSLCADFSASWEEFKKNRYLHERSRFAQYIQGRNCFEFKVEHC